jgi:hypothetical protein
MLALALSASAASADGGDPVVKAPRAYTNRVQMHNVPLMSRKPEARESVVRESVFEATAPAALPSSGLPEGGQIAPPPMLMRPPAQRGKDTEKKDWILRSPTEQILVTKEDKTEKKDSGWGWLADEVARTTHEKEEVREREDEKDAGPASWDEDGAGLTNRDAAVATTDRDEEDVDAYENDAPTMASEEEEMVRRAMEAQAVTNFSEHTARTKPASPDEEDPLRPKYNAAADRGSPSAALTSWKRADMAPRWNAWRASDEPAGTAQKGADAERPARESFEAARSSESIDQEIQSRDLGNRMGMIDDAGAAARRAEAGSRGSFDPSSLGGREATTAGGDGWWGGSRSPWSGDAAAGGFQPFNLQPSAVVDAPPPPISASSTFDQRSRDDFGSDLPARTTTLPW